MKDKERVVVPAMELMKLIAEMPTEDMRQVLGYAQGLASRDAASRGKR